MPVVAESNETLIAKKVIRVLDCNTNIDVNELCGLWNFNKCPTDKSYCQPFNEGDIIYKQFFTPPGYYFKSFLHIIDSATGIKIPNAGTFTTTETGTDLKGNIYGNLIIDTSLMGSVTCFYISFTGFTCQMKDPADLSDFNTCVADLVSDGYSTKEAQEICLDNMCPDSKEVYYSEPYCLNKCRPSILIEGFYPGYDCNGNFYGKFASGSLTNSYKSQFRAYGIVEPANFNIEETLVGNKRKSTKKLTAFLLMMKPVPFYVAEQLANIFASQKVYVDSVEYLRAASIAKDNEEGSMWIIKSTLLQECNEINFTCDQ